jgi:hypothetical protein
VDITAHALTKYPSGGGDVLMGSIITRDANLHMRIKLTHMRLGIGIGANDAELLLRSLPSVGLRYHAHDVAARDLARWLGQQPAVVQVLHPALEEAPGHVHWKALCGAAHGGQGAAAGLFSVVIDPKYGQDAVDRFCDSLQLFKLGYSWGGPISLVVPYDIERMRSQPHAQLKPGPSCVFDRSGAGRRPACRPGAGAVSGVCLIALSVRQKAGLCPAFLWSLSVPCSAAAGEVHFFVAHDAGAFGPFVAKPDQQKQRQADVGGDDAGPVDAVLGEGFVVLAQGDDQTQHKGKDGAEGKGRCAVGQLVQLVALCFAAFAEAVVADGNAQPGHKPHMPDRFSSQM